MSTFNLFTIYDSSSRHAVSRSIHSSIYPLTSSSLVSSGAAGCIVGSFKTASSPSVWASPLPPPFAISTPGATVVEASVVVAAAAACSCSCSCSCSCFFLSFFDSRTLPFASASFGSGLTMGCTIHHGRLQALTVATELSGSSPASASSSLLSALGGSGWCPLGLRGGSFSRLLPPVLS